MIKHFSVAIALLSVMLLLSCTTEFDDKTGLAGFYVQIVDGPIGAPDAPQPFPEEPVRYVLKIRAMDSQGNLDASYNGKIAFRVEPVGRVAEGQPARLEIENGKADNVELLVDACHGAVTIWVEDAGGIDVEGTYAVGATQVMYFQHPTIAQIQRTDNIQTSALQGDFAEVRVADRNVVVTNIRRDGFYCQDLAEPEGAYAGMFVYTHNLPEHVEEGTRLATLRGQVDEYFGFTELGFPDYLPADTAGDRAEPVLIGTGRLADDDVMEALESSLVQIENVTVCPVDEQYYTYDQWRVTFGTVAQCDDETATILVAETGGFDSVDPASMEGQTLARVTGNLRFHVSATPRWMIVPRHASDIE